MGFIAFLWHLLGFFPVPGFCLCPPVSPCVPCVPSVLCIPCVSLCPLYPLVSLLSPFVPCVPCFLLCPLVSRVSLCLLVSPCVACVALCPLSRPVSLVSRVFLVSPEIYGGVAVVSLIAWKFWWVSFLSYYMLRFFLHAQKVKGCDSSWKEKFKTQSSAWLV